MEGSGFTIVTILKFSTLWTEETFFPLHMFTVSSLQRYIPNCSNYFFNFHCPKKKKKSKSGATCTRNRFDLLLANQTPETE